MPELIGNYQISSFTTPVNATTADADVVRGNDNSVRTGLNSHDADAGIHLQSSLLADRPVAGVVGRKWLTSDDKRIFFDDGSNWQELAYAKTASPVFTGTVSVTGTVTITGSLTVSSSATFSSTLAVNGSVTFNSSTVTQTSVGGGYTFSGTGTHIIQASNGNLNLLASGQVQVGAYPSGSPFIQFITSTGNIQAFAGLGGGFTFVPNNGGTAWEIRSDYKLYVGGNRMLTSSPSPAYIAPTGTTSRGTFDQSTVTLPQLAQRLAALILDLQVHGLIG